MGLNLSKAIRTERISTPRSSYTLYFFECSGCGVEMGIQHGYSKKHSGMCMSCAHKKEPYQAAFTQLLGSKKRGIEIDLTLQEFQELCQIKGCHYCGATINRSLSRGQPGYRGYFLDRKDNDRGYSKDNCVPCCWPCNQAKGNRFSYEEFVAISQKVTELRGRSSNPDFRAAFLGLNQWEE